MDKEIENLVYREKIKSLFIGIIFGMIIGFLTGSWI